MTSLRIFKAGFSVMGIIILSLCLGLTVLSVNAYAERSTPVTVVNPSTDPVPVTNIFPREPVNFEKLIIEEAAAISHPIYTVPVDKLLVIESVSIFVAIPPSDEAVASISIWAACTHDCPKILNTVFIPLFNGRSAVTTNSFVGTQSLRMYVASGDSVYVNLDRLSEGGDTFFLNVGCTGYLLPLESPTLSP